VVVAGEGITVVALALALAFAHLSSVILHLLLILLEQAGRVQVEQELVVMVAHLLLGR
jgi:hypothetical protein